MNVLIISQSFKIGGLETNILNYCASLKKAGVHIYFATSVDADITIIEPYIKGCLRLEQWVPVTGRELRKNTRTLVEYMREFEIQIVHLHPYEGAIQGAIAAQLIGLPYFITIHSPSNLHPLYGITYRHIMSSGILPRAEAVYCVSTEVEEFLQKINREIKTKVVPNSIDVDIFNSSEYNSNGPWVAVSRLDNDKIEGLKDGVVLYSEYVKNSNSTNRDLLIIGDGNEKTEFQNWIQQNFPDLSIKFKGSSNNINEEISEASLVLGMGRVVLEAASSNKPVVLVGYDGLKGLVTRENFNEFSKCNFSGRNVLSKSFVEILESIKQLEKSPFYYFLRELVLDSFSSDVISKVYLKDLYESESKHISLNTEWAKQVIQVSEVIDGEDVLSPEKLPIWAQYVEMGMSAELKLIMGVYSEMNNIQLQNRNLVQEISMSKQHIHDISISNTQNDQELKNKIALLESEIKNNSISLIDANIVERFRNDIIDLKSDHDNAISKLQFEIDELRGDYNNSLDIQRNLSLEKETYIKEMDFLNYKINAISEKVHNLNKSKFFKVLNLLKRFRTQFLKGDFQDKEKFVKWFYAKVRKKKYFEKNIYNPLHEIYELIDMSIDMQKMHPNQAGSLDVDIEKATFKDEYTARKKFFEQYLNSNFYSSDFSDLISSLQENLYKGIIVYPAAVDWEPVQRPQQFLKELAKKGYLCIFVENKASSELEFRRISKNLFCTNREDILLPWLYSRRVIILCTWLMQMSFADCLPHKLLWYDILDNPDFLSLYDKDTLLKHSEVLKEADIVTYSALNLKKYIKGRDDACYLPNASSFEDFSKEVPQPPIDMVEIVNEKKPIIGYYGAIEEWFDLDLLFNLAERKPMWNIVLIGRSSLEGFKGKTSNYHNIHYLGEKPYSTLHQYSNFFDVGIIPFLVNDLTNSVSPVKFFEYQAAGLPVVSTPIAEMYNYESEFVYLAQNIKDFEASIEKFLLLHSVELKNKIRLQTTNNSWSSRVEKFEELILNTSSAWSIYANVFTENKIATMTASFLSFKGDNYYSGGAERYLIDLAEICKKLGKELIIYQYGDFSWMRRFKGIKVVSLSRNKLDTSSFTIERIQSFNRVFFQLVNRISHLNIYSAFFEAWPKAPSPSIGISHGVAWDGPNSMHDTGTQFWEINRRFIEGARACDKIVSVDSNTANWFQTIDFETGQKMQVITNYVDLSEFIPRENYDKLNENKIIILYPRRLYAARGLYIVLEILDDLLREFPNVELHFVGKGFDEDTNHVLKKQKRWGERVKWYWRDPAEMNEVYRLADITLIPTVYSEGTSLSCLEAMASANAIVATRIGGLTDLIINNYNGLLIDPDANSLKNALYDLLNNPDKIISFKERSFEVARAFSKKNWQMSWTNLINESITEKGEQLPLNKLVEIYISQMSELNGELGKRVKEYLENGDLVYVRCNNISNDIVEQWSFDRLQYMNWNNERLDDPDYVIATRNCANEVSKFVNHIHLIL